MNNIILKLLVWCTEVKTLPPGKKRRSTTAMQCNCAERMNAHSQIILLDTTLKTIADTPHKSISYTDKKYR